VGEEEVEEGGFGGWEEGHGALAGRRELVSAAGGGAGGDDL
jgi:hypothetical protein